MKNLRPFRFGVLVPSAPSKEDWIAKARRVPVFGDYLETFAPVMAQFAGK